MLDLNNTYANWETNIRPSNFYYYFLMKDNFFYIYNIRQPLFETNYYAIS